MVRKSKVTDDINKVNDYRKIANDVEKDLKSEKFPQRRTMQLSLKKRMELWARMEEGDIDALAELSYIHGLWSKETYDDYLKMENEPDYD